jgi:hypothetical protein
MTCDQLSALPIAAMFADFREARIKKWSVQNDLL